MDEIYGLTQSIREEARRLGFALVGITPARATPLIDNFRAWLADGCQGEMSYLERHQEKRARPELVLPGVRTVLVVALNYYTPEPSSPYPAPGALRGVISRYARGRDYHPVLRQRLRTLLDFIRSVAPEAAGFCSADTGPVMEKIWGAETALGWMGKHTGLVSRQLGSYFFIGVILLNIQLQYDDKGEGMCGDCQKCITACPTGAISTGAPYRLDARRCLSYLTIEFRGVIPRALRTLMGNRIFGCDACHDACPWNRQPPPTTVVELMPRQENRAPELLALARITRAEFERRFGDTSVRRATRDGLLRNVLIALGNTGDPAALPVLGDALADESPLVRAHAAWALGQMTAAAAALALLATALVIEMDDTVRDEIQWAQVQLGIVAKVV